MLIHDTVEAFRASCDEARASRKRIALVPTMGALHAGHLALVRGAKARADVVAVSVFVNPTQFGPNEDFSRYPRSLERDLQSCRDTGVGIAFTPSVEEMYPQGEQSRVRVNAMTEHLCGRTRPVHFEGVTTVVAKLLNACGQCVAVFGRKDYQQLKVVERMCRDLMMPVEIVGLPTVREADGLALSSRNAYLSAEDRARALSIPRALSEALLQARVGDRRVGDVRRAVHERLESAGLRVDYASVADADHLEPMDDATIFPERALIAIAAFAGTTRLIDNVVVGEDPPPIMS